MSFDESGFVVIKKLFEKSEIDLIVNKTIQYFQDGGGFIMEPGFAKPNWIIDQKLSDIRDIVESKKIEETISQIIGEKVFFIGHNDLHLNIQSGWHKDKLSGNASQFEINSPWEIVDGESMKIFKVITYFQDHTNNEDGLQVKIGSHLVENMNHGQNKRIYSTPGDSILFDQRITHRGGYSGGYNRVSLTMGYGVKNIFFDQFKKGTEFRQNAQNANKSWRY
jgi:hypothetical protein